MNIVCERCGVGISHCPLYPNACGKIKDAQYIIAARDKEWVEWFDDLIIGCDGGWGTDCANKPIILDISIEQWQERKRSVGL